MKGNKGKEVAGEGDRLETESQARPLAGDKRNLCLRTWIWEISPVDDAKRLSMARPK